MATTYPWYNHPCTQCGKRFDCNPCLEPKIHGLCSRMHYPLVLYGTSQVQNLTMYFCTNECAFECFTGIMVINGVLDRIMFIEERLQRIRETIVDDVHEAERMAQDLLKELEGEKERLREELADMGEEVESEEEEYSDESRADYVDDTSESSDQDSAEQSMGWYQFMKKMQKKEEEK